jgi:hypothetical protein
MKIHEEKLVDRLKNIINSLNGVIPQFIFILLFASTYISFEYSQSRKEIRIISGKQILEQSEDQVLVEKIGFIPLINEKEYSFIKVNGLGYNMFASSINDSKAILARESKKDNNEYELNIKKLCEKLDLILNVDNKCSEVQESLRQCEGSNLKFKETISKKNIEISKANLNNENNLIKINRLQKTIKPMIASKSDSIKAHILCLFIILGFISIFVIWPLMLINDYKNWFTMVISLMAMPLYSILHEILLLEMFLK